MKTQIVLCVHRFRTSAALASIAVGSVAVRGDIIVQSGITLESFASRPALSSPPTITGSSATVFSSIVGTSQSKSFSVTNWNSGGGANADGTLDAFGCFIFGIGVSSGARMFGDVGVWPNNSKMFEQGGTAEIQLTDGCISSAFGIGAGTLQYSSFPSGTIIVNKVAIRVKSFVSKPSPATIGGGQKRSVLTNHRRRYAVLFNSTVVGTFQQINDEVTASAGWSGPTVSYEFGTKIVSFESAPSIPVVGVGGGLEISASTVQVDENAFDFNGDGRFDQADVTWLAGQIPSIDPALIAVANLVSCPPPSEDPECEEIVDGDDLAVVEQMLEHGLGSVKFGDRDGDGCVTCADAIHDAVDVDAQFDAVDTSSSLYNIGLDANGDGILDATDRAAFYALVNHSDFNNDGIVDDADFLIFVGYYNTLVTAEGDQNGDNITDDADYVIFSSRYNDLVCPTCS